MLLLCRRKEFGSIGVMAPRCTTRSGEESFYLLFQLLLLVAGGATGGRGGVRPACQQACDLNRGVGVLQDNLGVFLRGCEELGLKGSQLFDPGDLQDTSTRPTAK